MKPTEDKLLWWIANGHDRAADMLSWIGSRRWTDLLVFGILLLLSLMDGPWMTRWTCGLTSLIVLVTAGTRYGSQAWADNLVNDSLTADAWEVSWGRAGPRPIGNPHGADGAVGPHGDDFAIVRAAVDAALTTAHQAALERMQRMEGEQAQAFVEELRRDMANLRQPVLPGMAPLPVVINPYEEQLADFEEGQQVAVVDHNGIPWVLTSSTTITFTGNGAENSNPVA